MVESSDTHQHILLHRLVVAMAERRPEIILFGKYSNGWTLNIWVVEYYLNVEN